MKLKLLPTEIDLAHAGAADFVAHAQQAIALRDRFVVALTGGTTPRRTYQLLATAAYAAQIDWSRVHVFWGDERCVPPDHRDSNFRMARLALLDHVPIPPQQVHRMRGELEPHAAAAAYQQLLDEIVGPQFDLIHLGMGADAHIASLFPGSDALRETALRVRAQYAPSARMWRITLTPVAINQAAAITFIVAGHTKAEAVARVLEGPRDPLHTPAQIVAPAQGHPLWLLDAAAASRLKSVSHNPTPSMRSSTMSDQPAHDVRTFRLAEENRNLRGRLRRDSGPTARTLVKNGPLRATLVSLQAGGTVQEHQASGPITIHVLSGSLAFRIGEETHALTAGDLLSLGAGIRHSVDTEAGADFLVTIALSEQTGEQPRPYADIVDDTLDDSFPASDPPSWAGQ